MFILWTQKKADLKAGPPERETRRSLLAVRYINIFGLGLLDFKFPDARQLEADVPQKSWIIGQIAAP